MFQYLQALGLLGGFFGAAFALAGGMIVTFIIAGWGWFQNYFRELGIDVNSISGDGSLARIEYYLSPGAKSVVNLITLRLWPEISNEFLTGRPIFGGIAFVLILAIFAFFRIQIYKLRKEYDLYPNNSSPPGNGIKFFMSALAVMGILLFGILIVRAGEWTAARDVRNLTSGNLPRVQLLFKSDITGLVKPALIGSVFRKVFMDASNIYVYSESEETRGQIPPIYVFGLSEISRIRMIKD
jgi:hypothetical protein